MPCPEIILGSLAPLVVGRPGQLFCVREPYMLRGLRWEFPMTLREIWQRLTTTRYARTLEAELARERAETHRLRAENRALLNSILGIAGIPPLPAPPPEASAAGRFVGRSFSSDNTAVPFPGALAPEAPAHARAAAPMRRRSWQQINRLLELESARKQKPS